ncbi:metallophosphoesterase [bacterium]|nr:metallophosphoesterase [bacterium]
MRTFLIVAILSTTITAQADIVPGEPPVGNNVTTFVVLPDTQNYSQHHPEIYEAQTRWIVEQKEKRNIAAVLHLGDITNTNAIKEWEVARKSMSLLDGQIPYFMAVGNHDYGPGGRSTTRETPFNEYFPISKMAKTKTFGGSYDKEPERSDNTYHLLEAAGRKWLIISLEFGPRNDIVRWANEVVTKYPDRSVILITHAFVFSDGTRYDWKKKGKDQTWNPHSYGVAKLEGGVNDGEELWEKLVSKYPNFVMTINGHVLNDGLGYLVTEGAAGQPVHQMLVNYQMLKNGGNGWLRLLEIQEDGKSVKVHDYSPTLKSTNTSVDNQFSFQLAPPSP